MVAEKDPPMTDVTVTQTLDGEAQAWLMRLTSGDATAADAQALKAWCGRSPAHARAFAEANLLWDRLEKVARLPGAGDTASHRGGLPSRRWFMGGAIAASVAAAGYLVVRPPMELWPSPQEFAADYRTRTAERREIAMGDGVTIELNTRSSLNVSPQANERQIELIAGEAAISVSSLQAGALTVRAAGGLVHASDAQFNLRSDAGRSVVTCHRGTLAVDYAGRTVDLGAGRQLAYSDGVVGAPVTSTLR